MGVRNGTYKVLHGALGRAQHDRRRVVGHLALGLGVDADEVELFPHSLHQLVNVPPVLRADGHRVGDAVEQVEFLDADAVNLVEHVNDRDVASALGFEDIDQVVDGGVAPNGDICRADLVSVIVLSVDLFLPQIKERRKTPTRS